MQATEASKVEALAAWLEVDTDELSESSYDDSLIEYGREEYLVLTDSEADGRTEEYVRDSLWAFRSSFLVNYMPEGVTEDVLEPMQEKLCEDATPAIVAMVGDRLDELVEDAISSDGRGHFLSGYDGEEIELTGDLYAYRTN